MAAAAAARHADRLGGAGDLRPARGGGFAGLPRAASVAADDCGADPRLLFRRLSAGAGARRNFHSRRVLLHPQKLRMAYAASRRSGRAGVDFRHRRNLGVGQAVRAAGLDPALRRVENLAFGQCRVLVHPDAGALLERRHDDGRMTP